MEKMAVTEVCWVHSVREAMLWVGGTTRYRPSTSLSLTPSQANENLVILPQQSAGLWSSQMGCCGGNGWWLYCGVPGAHISCSYWSALRRLISIDCHLRLAHLSRWAVFRSLTSRSHGLTCIAVEGHYMILWQWSLLKWPGALISYSHRRSHSRVFSIVHLLSSACIPGVS